MQYSLDIPNTLDDNALCILMSILRHNTLVDSLHQLTTLLGISPAVFEIGALNKGRYICSVEIGNIFVQNITIRERKSEAKDDAVHSAIQIILTYPSKFSNVSLSDALSTINPITLLGDLCEKEGCTPRFEFMNAGSRRWRCNCYVIKNRWAKQVGFGVVFQTRFEAQMDAAADAYFRLLKGHV